MKKIILLLAIILCFNTTCFAFSDVDDKMLDNALADLTGFGIISGYSDGTFRPDKNITRAEFSKMVMCAARYDGETYEKEASFSDVTPEHWAYNYIYTAKDMGIINGMNETTFAPESNVTYEQAIKMLVYALGYGDKAIKNGGYPDGYIKEAEELSITNGIDFSAKDNATRGKIALMISNALNIPYYKFLKGPEGYTPVLSNTVLREQFRSPEADADSEEHFEEYDEFSFGDEYIEEENPEYIDETNPEDEYGEEDYFVEE